MGYVIRKIDSACTPVEVGTSEYSDYLANPSSYIVSQIQIPYSITQRQMRLTLLDIGIYDQVEAAVNAMTGEEGKAARITWTWAQDIKRDNPLLIQLATTFNLSSQEVDNLFIAAASKE